MTSTKGIRCPMIWSTEILVTAHAANRLTPNGGVIMPSARLTIITTPKCTGSMPKCTATGTRIGASTMIAAEVSMNMPITKRIALTPNRKLALESSTVVIQLPMASGMPARVISNAKRPAFAMMNMITALEITDFFRMA